MITKNDHGFLSETWKSGADIGWTAGIIDGEGCIDSYCSARKDEQKTGSWTIRLSVINTDIRILEKLQALWGGSICRRKNYHPERHNDAWNWCIRGVVACDALRVTRSRLVSKGEQADVALEFGPLLNRDHHPRKLSEDNLCQRRELALKLRELKHSKRSMKDGVLLPLSRTQYSSL